MHDWRAKGAGIRNARTPPAVTEVAGPLGHGVPDLLPMQKMPRGELSRCTFAWRRDPDLVREVLLSGTLRKKVFIDGLFSQDVKNGRRWRWVWLTWKRPRTLRSGL